MLMSAVKDSVTVRYEVKRNTLETTDTGVVSYVPIPYIDLGTIKLPHRPKISHQRTTGNGGIRVLFLKSSLSRVKFKGTLTTRGLKAATVPSQDTTSSERESRRNSDTNHTEE